MHTPKEALSRHVRIHSSWFWLHDLLLPSSPSQHQICSRGGCDKGGLTSSFSLTTIGAPTGEWWLLARFRGVGGENDIPPPHFHSAGRQVSSMSSSGVSSTHKLPNRTSERLCDQTTVGGTRIQVRRHSSAKRPSECFGRHADLALIFFSLPCRPDEPRSALVFSPLST